jgi:hypothetical protein
LGVNVQDQDSPKQSRSINLLICILSVVLFAAPAISYASGNRHIPSLNRVLTDAPGFQDGWEIVKIAGNAVTDRLPLRDKAIDIDSYIDRNVFKEEPAFGGAATPQVLEGSDGFLFLKDAFDAACNPHGTPSSVSANLKRFADIIQRSGRKIVITVAPDKSSVLTDKLPSDHPQSECHRLHQDQIWKSLKEADIPGYIDLRETFRDAVVETRRPLFLRQDSHWSSDGSLVALKQVVEKFKNGVWRDSDIAYNGEIDYTGDLEAMRGGTKVDQSPFFSINRPTIKVVQEQYDEAYPPGYRRLSEMSGPDGSLIEGNTLMLFDSFGMAAIEQVVPYFKKLETMNFNYFETNKWIERIRASQNVWFLCVERSLEYRLTYDMGSTKFLDALDKALNG